MAGTHTILGPVSVCVHGRQNCQTYSTFNPPSFDNDEKTKAITERGVKSVYIISIIAPTKQAIEASKSRGHGNTQDEKQRLETGKQVKKASERGVTRSAICSLAICLQPPGALAGPQMA